MTAGVPYSLKCFINEVELADIVLKASSTAYTTSNMRLINTNIVTFDLTKTEASSNDTIQVSTTSNVASSHTIYVEVKPAGL